MTARAIAVPPWNKGKKLSAEHRAKISAAMTGRQVRASTRRKLSELHTGRAKSDATRRKLAAVKKAPLSEESKARISNTKKENQLATRRIVEALKMEAVSRARAGVGGGRLGGMVGASAAASFEQRLKAYRDVKEELRPWSNKFQEEHGRLPGLKDVEATQIPWLVSTYKSFMLLRLQLYQELQELREKLEPNNPAFMNRKKRAKPTRTPAGSDVLAAFSYARRAGKPSSDAASGSGSTQAAPAPMTNGERVSSAIGAAQLYQRSKSVANAKKADVGTLLNIARAQTSSNDPTGRLAAAFRAAAKYKQAGVDDVDGSSEPPTKKDNDDASQAASDDPTGRLAAIMQAAAEYKKQKRESAEASAEKKDASLPASSEE